MAEQITISGHVFNVDNRYEEGHELTANEAAALNQTYHENLRNNFAKKVEEQKNGADRIEDQRVLANLQDQLDKYAAEYEFGVRTAGGYTRDPVMAEAMKMAKDRALESMRKKGIKRKDVEASAITERAKKILAKNPSIMDLARERVSQLQAMATADLDDED